MSATVESLTHLGMGRTDAGDFVPRVLPGEIIEVTEDGARVLTPSPQRVAAPCRHFKSCGGCAMQHAADDFVADWKLGIVQKALGAHGLTPDFLPLHISPPQSRRRAKLAGKRTKKGAMVGFHARGSDTLIPVPDCQLLTPGIVALFPDLEQLTVIAASRKAEIALTVTESQAGADILIGTELPLTPQLRVELAAFAQGKPIARLTWADEPVVTLHPPYQTFGAALVTPPPGAFLQATADGEAALLRAVQNAVGDAKRIIDLFAGCGTFALPLAEQAEVHAVEGEAAMLDALDRGWREAQGLKRVTTETRDLFRRPLEPDEFRHVEAVVIDPPRAGAEAQVATLAQSEVPRIAMVSCNPVTFARDAAILATAGFSLDWVQVVDQFRWSAHVEVAAQFTRP